VLDGEEKAGVRRLGVVGCLGRREQW